MKKKSFIIISLLFVLTLTASAQIENEIKNYVDSTEILTNKGRKFLAKSIREGNLAKSKEVYHFLMMKGEERNCWSFSFNEQLLLNVIFRDWDTLKRLLEEYRNTDNYICYQNMEPVEDAIYNELKKNKPTIERSNNSTLNDEDSQILKILFHILEFGSKNDEYDQLIKSFNKQYPTTKYKNFVKNYLPEASLKGAIGYYIAPKYTMLSGSLSNYFRNQIGFAFSMDFNISKMYISMYMEGGPLKLTQPLTLVKKNGESHTFATGDSFNNMNIGFKTGYYLLRDKKFHIAPYATLLGGGFMESNLYEDDNKDEFSIYDNFTPGLGVNFEYKIGGYKSKNPTSYMYYTTNNIGYFSIKLDAGFMTIPTFKDALQMKGSISYVTLGLVWAIGEF